MNIDIKITGGGKPSEVAAALREIAKEIEAGEHNDRIKTHGKSEWEDTHLFTTITEEIA